MFLGVLALAEAMVGLARAIMEPSAQPHWRWVLRVATVIGQLLAIGADMESVPKAVAVLLLTSIAWDVGALLLAVWVC